MIEIIFYKKETRLLEARFFFVKILKQVQDDDEENSRLPLSVDRLPSVISRDKQCTHTQFTLLASSF